MRKLDISKSSNKKCEHCKHYTRYSKSKAKKANPLGYCDLKNTELKYWKSCPKFIWRDEYIGLKSVNNNTNGVYTCRRCKRPLTDSDSIARGFGLSCYEKHLRDIIKRSKRLF